MLVIRGPVWYPDSYSGNVRNLALALDKLGIEVKLVNTPLENWKHVPFPMLTETHDRIKFLVEREVTFPYTLVNHTVAHNFLYDPNAEKNIGFTMFETDRLPQPWMLPCMAMDEIWTPSVWNHEVFYKTGLKKQKMEVVPLGIDPRFFNDSLVGFKVPELEGKKVFGCCFDWTERKNGEQIIVSFLKAFQGRKDVALVLKCYSKDSIEKSKEILLAKIKHIRKSLNILDDPTILIFADIMPDELMGSFYKTLDFHISISHGESWNKPVLECMACGVPTIISMFSGHMDFCNAENSLPIADTQMGPVSQAQVKTCGQLYANALWGYTAEECVIENLKYAANMNEEDKARMKQACLDKAGLFTWEKIAQFIKDKLLC